MEFRTIIPIAAGRRQIDYNSAIFSVGSCFAVNIAEKFHYFKFRSEVNPTGILFHPEVILNFFTDLETDRMFTDADLIFNNERFHCFDAHSDMSGTDRTSVIGSLNKAVESSKVLVRNATHIVITYGTAWVYRHLATGKVVANCHKFPQNDFDKKLLTPERIRECVQQTTDIMRRLNPLAQIIFTISPVRHIKDGFVENQRSKSNLISGLHESIIGCPKIAYFPSYEIMIDELRDYRFYADDMVHPSRAAIDYIWERFADAWISAGSRPVMNEVDSVCKSLRHRPFNPDSEAHRKFVEAVETRIGRLRERFPHMDFENT